LHTYGGNPVADIFKDAPGFIQYVMAKAGSIGGPVKSSLALATPCGKEIIAI
jgi:hypothetical protein